MRLSGQRLLYLAGGVRLWPSSENCLVWFGAFGGGSCFVGGFFIGMFRGVKKEPFTMDAAILWGTLPKDAKERILKNCFCPQCRAAAEMVDFKGAE